MSLCEDSFIEMMNIVFIFNRLLNIGNWEHHLNTAHLIHFLPMVGLIIHVLSHFTGLKWLIYPELIQEFSLYKYILHFNLGVHVCFEKQYIFKKAISS